MNKNKNNEHIVRDSVMGAFIIIILAAGLISTYFLKEYTLILAGLFFFYIGICIGTIAKPKRDSNKFVGSLFGIIGFVIMATSLLAKYENQIHISVNFNVLIPILLLLGIILIVVISLLSENSDKKETYSSCTIPIVATCVAFNEGGHLLAPIYSYSFKNKKYTIKSNIYYSRLGLPEIGSTIEILINPREPNKACFKVAFESNSFKNGMAAIVLIFVIGTLSMIIINQYNNIIFIY